MNMDIVSMEDRAAASAVASLGGVKRSRDEEEEDVSMRGTKVVRQEAPPEQQQKPQTLSTAVRTNANQGKELKPYPFFYYEDHSTEKDPDPLTPLTSPGRVPNFPAKMHSILSRTDLSDIIAWMPHGRSWRVLKPREFEVRVIPTYFEHAKFSSFIRQANGWGFRRITSGRDRNSYYHPLFLRGLPHHCKKMKRPGVSEKQTADPDHEPDLYKISEMHPIPEKASDDSILLHCTLQGGPKARMPIYSGALSAANKSAILSSLSTPHSNPMSGSGVQLTPRDQAALNGFKNALGASEDQFKNLSMSSTSMAPSAAASIGAIPGLQMSNLVAPMHLSLPTTAGLPPGNNGDNNNKMNPLAMANQLAFANPNMAAAFQASSAASQFAAGFAAATALSHQQFQSMLGNLVTAGGGGAAAAGGMPPAPTASAVAAPGGAPASPSPPAPKEG